jgi:hypothetical protein
MEMFAAGLVYYQGGKMKVPGSLLVRAPQELMRWDRGRYVAIQQNMPISTYRRYCVRHPELRQRAIVCH